MGDHVAVVHHDLMSKGGGEAVAMVALEALQEEYDVTLVTLTEPDLEALNDYYRTSVEPMPVRIAGRIGPMLHDKFGLTYYVLQNALLGRYVRRRADEFDCVLSTINELGVGGTAVQYVHFPFDWTLGSDRREDIFHPTVDEDGLYEQLCTAVADVERVDFESDVVLANSRWTAEVFEDAYGIRPAVCYPPVHTDPFDDNAWQDREPGFVTLGRIERSKRIVEMIDVIDGVRDRGHDVHLHVVGPTVDEEYYAAVAALAADRHYVQLDGELSRETLVDRVCTHRYGIHGKTHEHFGMAIAELAAGGCVTFCPAAGGQPEVVAGREELLYDSPADAVEKIDRVLSGQPRRFRQDPAEIRRRFGRARFKREITDAIATMLDRRSVPDQAVSPARTGVDD